MTAVTFRHAVLRANGQRGASKISFFCRLRASLMPCTMSRVPIQRLGNGNGSVDAPAAFFEGFIDNHVVVEIDTAGGQGQSLRYPATGVIQDGAQGPYGPVGLRGGVQEGVALGGGEIEASAFGVVQLDAFVHDGTE